MANLKEGDKRIRKKTLGADRSHAQDEGVEGDEGDERDEAWIKMVNNQSEDQIMADLESSYLKSLRAYSR